MENTILKQQAKLRELLYVRPFDLQNIENEAIKLCDMTIDLFEERDKLKEKFEDFHADKEYEHLQNCTEFTSNEIFDFLFPQTK